MKYKVGDKVKIREDLRVEHLYEGRAWVTQGMHDLGGKIARITSVDERKGVYIIDLDGSYAWSAEMFEGMSEQGAHKSVTITVIENKVIAYCDSKMGVARCHPDDDFDFYTGAKIALARLEEADTPFGWLKEGVRYYVPQVTFADLHDTYVYSEDDFDKRNIERGTVFQTKKEAIECAKKMLAAIKNEG